MLFKRDQVRPQEGFRGALCGLGASRLWPNIEVQGPAGSCGPRGGGYIQRRQLASAAAELDSAPRFHTCVSDPQLLMKRWLFEAHDRPDLKWERECIMTLAVVP